VTTDIRLGRLRHRLVVEEPVDADDGAGGLVRTWQDAATVWAAVAAVSAAERFEAAQAGQLVSHRIVMRAFPALTTRHRLRRGTTLYEPRSFRATPAEDFFVVLAQEIAP
jgi:SPP1 family predicted phage head-tail adaptor